ncbi:MAG: hypothetical protein GEV06_21290 [Luteitalea sp.]|nr:hypothetical protein [Luteitalea sp.]
MATRKVVFGSLPPYPDPRERAEPFLVLGEQHHPTKPIRVAEPKWLTIPRRGLHTGVMILDAIGTGKPRPVCTRTSNSYRPGEHVPPVTRSAASSWR